MPPKPPPKPAQLSAPQSRQQAPLQQQEIPHTSAVLHSKRGLAWPVENTDPVFSFTRPGSKVSWLYNWSPNQTPNSATLNFVPMQWNAVNAENLANAVRTANASTILAFNEPELHDQANMSPEAAAEAWLRHIEPLRRQGVRAGSPGISSAPQGVPWLLDFLGRIRQRGSDIDFIALHWYGEGLGPFYDYLWSTRFQIDPTKNVWVTEFGCTNWNPQSPLGKDVVENFAKESAAYLDSLEWIERYAWFGAMRDTGTVGKWARMLDDEGRLTDLGKWYRDA